MCHSFAERFLFYLLKFFPKTPVEVKPCRIEYESFSGRLPLFSLTVSDILYWSVWSVLWMSAIQIRSHPWTVVQSVKSRISIPVYYVCMFTRPYRITLGSSPLPHQALTFRALTEPAQPMPTQKRTSSQEHWIKLGREFTLWKST